MVGNFHPVTHVIFDMDGLLLDTEPCHTAAFAHVLARYGKEFNKDAHRAIMGTTQSHCAKTLTSMYDLPLTAAQFQAEFEKLYPETFKKWMPLMPGAERLVKHLKAHNVPICVATSSDNLTYELKSQHHGNFLQLFDHIVVGSDDPEVKSGKPDPQIFLVAAQRFGKNAPKSMQNVLVFEDSVHGVNAALAAGMQVVWVPAPIADKNAVTPTLMLDSLAKFQPELFGLPPFS